VYARKDFGVANKAFSRDPFQPPSGSSRYPLADLLDARRHLGACMPMLAGNLVQVSN
jgi:hypothetical protein